MLHFAEMFYYLYRFAVAKKIKIVDLVLAQIQIRKSIFGGWSDSFLPSLHICCSVGICTVSLRASSKKKKKRK